MKELKGKTCCKNVYHSLWSSGPCGRKAKIEVNGLFYCGIHEPIKKKQEEERKIAMEKYFEGVSTEEIVKMIESKQSVKI